MKKWKIHGPRIKTQFHYRTGVMGKDYRANLIES
jgi:hypothetical protein